MSESKEDLIERFERASFAYWSKFETHVPIERSWGDKIFQELWFIKLVEKAVIDNDPYIKLPKQEWAKGLLI